MKKRYTPSPWRIVKVGTDMNAPELAKIYVCYGKPDTSIDYSKTNFPPDQCLCGCGRITYSDGFGSYGCGDGTNEGNANIIKVAPEIYELLVDMRDACEYVQTDEPNRRMCVTFPPEFLDRMERLIEKANDWNDWNDGREKG